MDLSAPSLPLKITSLRPWSKVDDRGWQLSSRHRGIIIIIIRWSENSVAAADCHHGNLAAVAAAAVHKNELAVTQSYGRERAAGFGRGTLKVRMVGKGAERCGRVDRETGGGGGRVVEPCVSQCNTIIHTPAAGRGRDRPEGDGVGRGKGRRRRRFTIHVHVCACGVCEYV